MDAFSIMYASLWTLIKQVHAEGYLRWEPLRNPITVSEVSKVPELIWAILKRLIQATSKHREVYLTACERHSNIFEYESQFIINGDLQNHSEFLAHDDLVSY